MTSVLAAPPSDIQGPTSTSRSKPMMAQAQEVTPPRNVKRERLEDAERGRRRSRSPVRGQENYDGGDTADGDANTPDSSHSDGPARKRRRSRKGLDKKFECPEKECGKSYSRAEHLYRHQLNHSRKQIYQCDHEDCLRTFVRLDLKKRHEARHKDTKSILNRKSSTSTHVSTLTERPAYGLQGSASPEANRPGTGYSQNGQTQIQYPSSRDGAGSPYSPVTHTPPTGYPSGPPPNSVDYMHHEPGYAQMQTQRAIHHSPQTHHRPTIQTNMSPYGVLSPISNHHGYQSQPRNTPQSAPVMPYVPQHNFPAFSLPPSDFVQSAGPSMPRERSQTYPPPTSGEYPDHGQPQQSGEMIMLDQMSMQTTIPVFGSELNKSPFVSIPEDFITYLFNSSQPDASPTISHVLPQAHASYGENQQYSVPYYGTTEAQLGYFPNGPQQVMSVTNLLDQNLPESIISDEKSSEVFDYIKERFHEKDHVPVERQRDTILEGDRTDDNHMLSRQMMQAYIGSYWVHFSDQIPILHKPTFSPDRTPNLLLIAMMTIGASCLDKGHGDIVTKAGARLSNFLAWHLRWEIFMDYNFRPPAKLWIFQSLILLELYEKMYSTRELHERAHIHHATTITLMRRGRSLIGKSAMDSPPNPRDDRATNGSRHSSTGTANTPDEWWSHWITNEATRRAAFAAFVIDSIHATMFGHSTVMVAHEMRLPLPCDEKMWKATSGAEVGRVEANLLSNGLKPVSFLEGLKRTLSNQEVRTNSFGRTILMAGLLSVSWHMNQRDLQVNSLGGVSQHLGGRDKWRATLTRAFDTWLKDFDKSLDRADSDPYPLPGREANVVLESRTVLHHLAHMAMHVDIVDCQIFARAKRLLGRAIGSQDLSSAQRRMRDMWAPSAKARDATYYALRFLMSVLLPHDAASPHSIGYPNADPYSARDDVLLHRPWVLYFAALVVWCYGYALEGACSSKQPPATPREKYSQMRDYLLKYGNVSSPEGLKAMKGINDNTALLMVLKDAFAMTRWELLHEGATLLDNCIRLNSGAQL